MNNKTVCVAFPRHNDQTHIYRRTENQINCRVSPSKIDMLSVTEKNEELFDEEVFSEIGENS